MKRLPLFGVIVFGLASCVAAQSTTTGEDPTNRPPTLDQIAEPIDEMLACFDTGYGTKCVERRARGGSGGSTRSRCAPTVTARPSPRTRAIAGHRPAMTTPRIRAIRGRGV